MGNTPSHNHHKPRPIGSLHVPIHSAKIAQDHVQKSQVRNHDGPLTSSQPSESYRPQGDVRYGKDLAAQPAKERYGHAYGIID